VVADPTLRAQGGEAEPTDRDTGAPGGIDAAALAEQAAD
jgi:hypothetical protein